MHYGFLVTIQGLRGRDQKLKKSNCAAEKKGGSEEQKKLTTNAHHGGNEPDWLGNHLNSSDVEGVGRGLKLYMKCTTGVCQTKKKMTANRALDKKRH